MNEEATSISAGMHALMLHNQRLRMEIAQLKQGNAAMNQGNLDYLITPLELIAGQRGEHWTKGVANRALEEFRARTSGEQEAVVAEKTRS